MGSVSTSQAFKLIGAPSADAFWGVVRRHPDLRKFLILTDRSGCIWDAGILEAAKAIFDAQRGRWPYRKNKLSIKAQLRNLRLTPKEREGVEKRLASLEKDWLKARDDESRKKLMGQIRLMRRILMADARREFVRREKF